MCHILFCNVCVYVVSQNGLSLVQKLLLLEELFDDKPMTYIRDELQDVKIFNQKCQSIFCAITKRFEHYYMNTRVFTAFSRWTPVNVGPE